MKRSDWLRWLIGGLFVLVCAFALPVAATGLRFVTAAQGARSLTTIVPQSTVLVNGTISTNTTWTASNVYVLQGVTIAQGVTLTVQPGTVVKFADNTGLDVNGTLLAEGTETQPIIFTSFHDDAAGGDTNGNGTTTSPAAGNWGGLYFTPQSSGSRLRHVQVSYGGYEYWGNPRSLYVQTSDLLVEASTIIQSSGHGLYAADVTPQLWGNTFRENSGYGIYYQGVGTSSSLAVTSTTFISNTNGAIYATVDQAQTSFDLTGNSSTGSPRNGLLLTGNLTGTVSFVSEPTFPLIASTLSVNAGTQLTLTPGTVVKFTDNTDLDVNGTLLAEGTETQPIIFTSFHDDAAGGDTNGNGTTTSPAAGNWGGLYFTPQSSGSRLRHVQVSYGGYEYWGNPRSLYVQTSDLLVEASTIIQSSGHGLYAADVTPQLWGNTFRENSGYGIYYQGVGTSSSLAVTSTTFISNTNGAIYATVDQAQTSFDLTGNSSTGSPRNGLLLTGNLTGTVSFVSEPTFPLIASTLSVNAGTQLTLTPGTVVKFTDNTDLDVNGTLLAEGTETQPIIFTSFHDDAAGGDTNGNGTTTSPAAGNWGGLYFTPQSSGSRLRHVQVRYGGYEYWGNRRSLYVQTSDLLVEASTIVQSSGHGLHAADVTPQLWGNTLRENSGYGIYYEGVGTSSSLGVTNTTFISNTSGAIYATLTDGAASFDLRGNSSTGSPKNGVEVTGSISGTVSFVSETSFPLIGNTLTVKEGAQLTLVPGTVVKFVNNTDLDVHGTLLAEGTEAQPIIFTSFHDDAAGGDTNGN
ncbi:hypothetical protein EYB53_002110, partial [Candidatus Chloroploca sp. M-50]|nr:hypothetical protein [Candidatus Chloroploca mongolica]